MKEVFSLRTVRKKILMLSKLAGLALIFSYVLSSGLPVNAPGTFFCSPHRIKKDLPKEHL